MAQQYISYEYPLNERIRTFLRADFLFQLARYRFNHVDCSWDARDCISTLIELCNLIERTEFKSELLKELEKHINNMQRLSKTPTVDHHALHKILNSLERCSETLKIYFDRQSFYPKDSDLFNSIRQRMVIPGGTCSFDLPAFHFWLHLPPKARQAYLSQWMELIEPLEKALTLVLDLTRQSSLPSTEMAINGTFQKALHVQSTYQLIRVNLRSDLGAYPEISGNKHRINIRFLQANFEQGKPMLANQDIPFEITCCSL